MNTHKLNIEKLEKLYPDAYIEYYLGCVEPGYDDFPALLANWNHVPNKVFSGLERLGFLVDWSDEYICCDECYKVFRCKANSYGWSMFGYIFDGFAICGECLPNCTDDYIVELTNNPRKAITPALEGIVNLESRGYTQVNGEFVNGLHPGQTDNPEKILNALLNNDPQGKFIFAISGVGQFDINFVVYKKD